MISFITDAYFHKIVGYHLAGTIEAFESIKALNMALSILNTPLKHQLFHHSDRGIQYCNPLKQINYGRIIIKKSKLM